MRTRILAITATLIICIAAGFTQDDPLPGILARIERYRQNRPVEKVHLHTDKPFYSIGDTVWFKAYVVNGEKNEPSSLSKILHVDLIDQANNVRKSLILPLTSGLSAGDFVLPAKYPEGSYRIRAYTTWMRNFGDTFIFEKTVPVVNALSSIIPAAPVKKGAVLTPAVRQTAPQPDVQFFPEGGELVNGIRSKVGFKITGADGKGIYVTGKVTDNEGQTVAEFTADHAGMGVFALAPQAGKTYAADVIMPSGAQQHVLLPKAGLTGHVLSVTPISGDSLLIGISSAAEMIGKEIVLVAHNNGVVYYAASTTIQSKRYNIEVSSQRFITGVTQFTLFNAAYKPVAERLVFIQRNDGLRIKMVPSKSAYAPREKVTMVIEVADEYGEPVTGSFSVAVTDQGKVPADEDAETTIFSNLLLTSGLKGAIEKPNYYFNGKSASDKQERLKQLDQLMLTQGWRKFNWDDASDSLKQPVYTPEKALTVSGSMTTAGGKPLAAKKVSLFSIQGNFPVLLDTITDVNGKFVFEDLDFDDSTRFVIKARDLKNVYNVKIKVDSIQAPDVSKAFAVADSSGILTIYRTATKQRFEEMSRYGMLNRNILLNEVQIVKKKAARISSVKGSSRSETSGEADVIIPHEKLQRYSNVMDALYGVKGISMRTNSYGVRFPVNPGGRTMSLSSPGGMPYLLVLDGTPVDADLINSIPGDGIEGIEVLQSMYNTTLYGSEGYSGVIVFTSVKGGTARGGEKSQDVLRIIGRGFSPQREFYLPRYDVTPVKMPDLRSTVYWNPAVTVDAKDGKATIDFFNSDSKGKFTIVAEGVAASGGLGRSVQQYEVK